jgi:truncated hemoglobin YjbI
LKGPIFRLYRATGPFWERAASDSGCECTNDLGQGADETFVTQNSYQEFDMSTQPQTFTTNVEHLRMNAYEQIGGMSGVSTTVKRFYKEMSCDPVLHPYFRETDLNWLAARQTQFVAQTLGAAITYKGPSMKSVHAFLGLTERHKWMVEQHLSLSLAHAKRGLRPSVTRSIVALVNPV